MLVLDAPERRHNAGLQGGGVLWYELLRQMLHIRLPFLGLASQQPQRRQTFRLGSLHITEAGASLHEKRQQLLQVALVQYLAECLLPAREGIQHACQSRELPGSVAFWLRLGNGGERCFQRRPIAEGSRQAQKRFREALRPAASALLRQHVRCYLSNVCLVDGAQNPRQEERLVLVLEGQRRQSPAGTSVLPLAE